MTTIRNSYTTTSTTQSGGGETTVISGAPQPTAASRALQPAIDAKQAQIDQFVKDNPSNWARSKQGLPPLTQEENAARAAKFRELSNEKTALKNQQYDAERPGLETTIEKPNTTTNTRTTTYGNTSVDKDVEAPDSDDAEISQQEEARLDAQPDVVTGGGSRTRTVQVNNQGQIVAGSLTDTTTPPVTAPEQVAALNENQLFNPATNRPVTAPTPVREEGIAAANEAAGVAITAPTPVREEGIAAANEAAGVAITAPALGTVETFRPTESTITAVTKEPAPDTYEAGGGGGNQGTITRVTYKPEDVPPTVDPAAGEAAANDQQSTIEGARGGNVEQNEQIEAAQQAATEQRLKEQQAIQAQFQSPANGDWRVKLKLPPQATYLYKDKDNVLLAPLAASDGVVFPYMPEIQTTYNADYDVTSLIHSNYRGYYYRSSYVGEIGITGTFTAQDTAEANYLLAVIQFFRSATKMFYGSQDSLRGAPPPLVYLFGLGQYQFNAHPCVISRFNYNLPDDVDYIRTKPNNYNVNFNNRLPKTQTDGNPISAVINRLRNALLPKGALPNVPQELLTVSQSVTNIDNSTYVPTKIQLQISLLPIQTRSQQSQQFSVKSFANGDLLKGGFW